MSQAWKPNLILPDSTEFQTPPEVCNYCASLVPAGARTILEPTPGRGNMVRALQAKGLDVTAPTDFFQLDRKNSWFDCVVMNPPFSAKSAWNVPQEVLAAKPGMRLGYWFLTECMRMSHNVIAIMPWFTIADSDVRIKHLLGYGMKSVTALPRKTFQYARVQTCILQLDYGYKGETTFRYLNHLPEYQNTLL